MKILLIDTCGATGSVALADESAVVASATLPGRTASERLVPAIRDLTADSLPSLDAVAVVHGPGSFTGVRVGISAAKGLCEALGLPLVAISRLAVVAHLAEAPSGTLIYALLDAGRGEFYVGGYMDGNRLRESLMTRDELLTVLDSNAAQAYAVVACEPVVVEALLALSPRLLAEPLAEDAMPLVLRRIRQRDFDDPATLDANYLRRTDAEIFAKPQPGSAATSRTAGTSVR
jgi:tRNA threonylcarbamoyladenosine biosynthesis protein TsaB